jgi:hypothetical protein
MLIGPDGRPVTQQEPEPVERMVEIVRSVCFKLNLGNYQSMDFLCSQKARCPASEVDSTSADLYEWCYKQVMDSVRDVRAKQAEKQRREA